MKTSESRINMPLLRCVVGMFFFTKQCHGQYNASKRHLINCKQKDLSFFHPLSVIYTNFNHTKWIKSWDTNLKKDTSLCLVSFRETGCSIILYKLLNNNWYGCCDYIQRYIFFNILFAIPIFLCKQRVNKSPNLVCV